MREERCRQPVSALLTYFKYCCHCFFMVSVFCHLMSYYASQLSLSLRWFNPIAAFSSVSVEDSSCKSPSSSCIIFHSHSSCCFPAFSIWFGAPSIVMWPTLVQARYHKNCPDYHKIWYLYSWLELDSESSLKSSWQFILPFFKCIFGGIFVLIWKQTVERWQEREESVRGNDMWQCHVS